MGTFDLTIISDPGVALNPGEDVWRADLRAFTQYDVDLLKPALLFSDTVSLVSARIEYISLAQSNLVFARHLLVPRYISFLRTCLAPSSAELQFFGLTAGDIPTASEAQRLLDRISEPDHEILDDIEEFEKKFGAQFEQFGTKAEEKSLERIALLISSETEEAERSGLLKVEGWFDGVPDLAMMHLEGPQEYYDRLAEHALKRVQEASEAGSAIMFEPGSRRIIPNAPDQSEIVYRISDRVSAAKVAMSHLAMLPSLKNSPMSEVLDVRQGLIEYLPQFRRAVLSLADELSQMSVEAPETIEAVIDKHWHSAINPALSELRHQARKGKFRRHILEEFSSSKDSMAAAAGAAVTIAGGSLFAGLAALVPGLAAGAYPFVKALNAAVKSRDDVKESQLYFVYEADRRLKKRGF